MADDIKKQDPRKTMIGQFPSGKRIYLARTPNASVRHIEFEDGGQVPEVLSGGWSSIHTAKDAVDAYLAQHHGVMPDEEPRVGKRTISKA